MGEPWVVTPLLEGSLVSSSCTLLSNASHRVVVDTGLSLQEEELRRAMVKHGLSPDDIDVVVNTHLHVDHCGNNAIFPRARIAVSRAEWDWTHAFYSALLGAAAPEEVALEFYPELASRDLPVRTIRNVARLARTLWDPERLGRADRLSWIEQWLLPDGLELIPSPGHTPHHISILVREPTAVLIAGDAVLHEDISTRVRTMVPYSQTQFDATRRMLLGLRVQTVPGHGRRFQPAPQAKEAG